MLLCEDLLTVKWIEQVSIIENKFKITYSSKSLLWEGI
jgi:hypothetical protein